MDKSYCQKKVGNYCPAFGYPNLQCIHSLPLSSGTKTLRIYFPWLQARALHLWRNGSLVVGVSLQTLPSSLPSSTDPLEKCFTVWLVPASRYLRLEIGPWNLHFSKYLKECWCTRGCVGKVLWKYTPLSVYPWVVKQCLVVQLRHCGALLSN